MTTHTPGPWNVTGLYVRERDGGLIASILDLWHGQRTPKAEKNANARLIAAAPDMLFALHRCIDALAANDAPNCEAAKEARAAITKATSPKGQ